MKTSSNINSGQPSLLTQIIGKIETMPAEKQQYLWMQLNKEELIAEARGLDASIKPSNLSEDEIVALCRKARKDLHEL